MIQYITPLLYVSTLKMKNFHLFLNHGHINICLLGLKNLNTIDKTSNAIPPLSHSTSNVIFETTMQKVKCNIW